MGNAGLQQDQGDRGYAAPVRFHSSVAPFIISIKSTKDKCEAHKNLVVDARSYLMQSMSMRCCSATLFSLFTLRWRAVNIFLF